MTANGIEQHVAGRLAEEIRESAAILYGNTDIRFSGSEKARLELKDALSELVALAERADEVDRLRAAAQALVRTHARRHPDAGFWTLNERMALNRLVAALASQQKEKE